MANKGAFGFNGLLNDRDAKVFGAIDEFVFTVDATRDDSSGTGTVAGSFTVPSADTAYDYSWAEVGGTLATGSGTATGADQVIVFGVNAVIQVSISPSTGGAFTDFLFANAGDKLKMLGVQQWGDAVWVTMSGMFYGCVNFRGFTCDDVPVLSTATVMQDMFYGCTLFSAAYKMNTWDVSGITNLQSCFQNCPLFNSRIGDWTLTALTNLTSCFRGASLFNQDITGWDATGVTSMASCFRDAASFDQPIGVWVTTALNNLTSTFYGASVFNQDISSWDVTGVTGFGSTFRDAVLFNQPIGTWTTTVLADMGNTFFGATAFNQPLANWSVALVTTMEGSFRNAVAFNQTLNGWTTTVLANMTNTFLGATAYDQPMSNWNVAAVTTMTSAFKDTSFNQDLSAWTTTLLTDLSSTFENNTAFDQSLAAFDVTALTTALDMLTGGGISTANYTATLIGWEAQVVIAAVPLSAGSSTYTTKTRDALVDTDTWVIVDGGVDDSVMFKITVDASIAGSTGVNHFAIPSANTDYNIYWEEVGVPGNNANEVVTGADHDIDFGSPGQFVVYIDPISSTTVPASVTDFRFVDADDKLKMVSVEQWGTAIWLNFSSMFYGCANFTGFTATDVPDLSSSSSLANTFRGCSVFVNATGINTWNTVTIDSLNATFRDAAVFNSDIGAWTTTIVDSMSTTFFGANLFDQDISGWNVVAVTTMTSAFRDTPFNQDISGWVTSALTDLSNAFRDNAVFDQDLGAWDITGLTTAAAMMTTGGLSTANYDSLLVGWEGQVELTGVDLGVGLGTFYTGGGVAATARGVLDVTSTWTIVDGGIAA
jgi:hypothetical protein